MNEIMLALEAMIARVVREEINAHELLTRDNPTQLAMVWRNAMRANPNLYSEVAVELAPPSPQMTTEMFGTLFAQFMNDAPNAFKEVVKNAVLDQGWFDAAIKAEVAESSSSSGDLTVPLVTDMINQRVVSEDRVKDCVKDLITAAALDGDFVSSDSLKGFIHDMDHDYFAFNDQVQSVVRDMEFSVSVDR